jgi:hypothetical protein
MEERHVIKKSRKHKGKRERVNKERTLQLAMRSGRIYFIKNLSILVCL